MTDWNLVFLGVIAVATLVMALIQIGVIVVAAKVARQAQQAVAKAQETLATAQQTITSVRDNPSAHRQGQRHRRGSVEDRDPRHRAGCRRSIAW